MPAVSIVGVLLVNLNHRVLLLDIGNVTTNIIVAFALESTGVIDVEARSVVIIMTLHFDSMPAAVGLSMPRPPVFTTGVENVRMES